MNVLFVILPLAVLFSSLSVLAFIWSVRDGQLDDLTTPALRMLREDSETSAVIGRPGGPIAASRPVRSPPPFRGIG